MLTYILNDINSILNSKFKLALKKKNLNHCREMWGHQGINH